MLGFVIFGALGILLIGDSIRKLEKQELRRLERKLYHPTREIPRPL